MTLKQLKPFIGKIMTVDAPSTEYVWMYKIIDIREKYSEIIVTHGLDIMPTPKMYFNVSFSKEQTDKEIIEAFLMKHTEYFNEYIRIPTKQELNTYRNATREIILLHSNKSCYGTK